MLTVRNQIEPKKLVIKNHKLVTICLFRKFNGGIELDVLEMEAIKTLNSYKHNSICELLLCITGLIIWVVFDCHAIVSRSGSPSAHCHTSPLLWSNIVSNF